MTRCPFCSVSEATAALLIRSRLSNAHTRLVRSCQM